MSRVRRAVLATAVLAAAICVGAAPAAGAATPRPALFRVGAASLSLDPQLPVYAGGFGASPPIKRVHDPLAVRAMYVSNGHHAIALAVVDSQAYFAAYQEGGDFGITSAREEAAARISRLTGGHMAASDIIVQGTHSHAGPTLEGIWGPVPRPYLRRVHDRTVAAIVRAALRARPAHLQQGRIDAPYLDNINTAQTDSYAGFAQDGQLSVLRAVDPRTGATIASFTSVPAHPDIVNGAHLKLLSADYFGFARATLERRLGGVAIVGPATLGREESPVQTTGLANSEWYSCVVSDLAARALGHARWVSDPTVRSSESFARIPGTNALLLGLVAAYRLPEAQRQQLLQTTGIYPIDRQDTPPYLTGNVIGTPLTALRVGKVAFLSMPGEPFPEVRYAIASATRGADQVIALSKGQDDLGYFYPTFAYPMTFVYPSDHQIYNVAPQAGDQVVEDQIGNVGRLGFATHFDVAHPLPADYGQGLRPGLQALASPATGDAGRDGTFRTTLQAIYEPAAFNGAPMAGKVHWDFGDGTRAQTGAVSLAAGRKEARFTHAFRPGRYVVTLWARDTRGDVARWRLAVRAYPRLRPYVTTVRRLTPDGGGSDVAFRASARGGEGTILAWRWRFSDGATAAGRSVRHHFARGIRPGAVLTVADAAGCSTARAAVRLRVRSPHRHAPRFTG